MRQLFWVAITRPNGSTARTPGPVKAPFMLLSSYLREAGVSLKKPASSLMLAQNKRKTRFERKRRVLPSLPWLRNQGRVNKVYQACDRHTEGACSMAGGDVVKVTVVPGGTSWLRCSASKLNTDRKPCVWYCKKIICLPARVRLANQRGCFHLKEILQQWERKEWNSGY